MSDFLKALALAVAPAIVEHVDAVALAAEIDRSERERVERLVRANRGRRVTAELCGDEGDEVRGVVILGRVRTLRATWDPDAADGWGAVRNDELRLVRVHVDGEAEPRSIAACRLRFERVLS